MNKKLKQSLNQIFENQKKFQKKIGKPFSYIDSKKIKTKEKLSDLYILSLIDECIELRNTYNKKSWVKKRFEINKEELQEELIDMCLFLINLTILWDISPLQLLDSLEEKQLKNFKRLKK